MKYLKPTEAGYYWYRPGTEWDDVWDIVKVQEYAKNGEKESCLCFQIFGWRNLNKVNEAEGIFGEKVADIKEPEEP